MAPRPIPFGEFAPDLADIGTDSLDVALNVFPGPNGYKPVPAPVPQSEALPAGCRGLFYVQKMDGSFDTYAATATNIYKLDSTDYSWDDVSRTSGGDYACPADEFWSGIQFGSRLILTNTADDPQYIDVDSGSNFAPLGGSPGGARFVQVMDNRVVLGNLAGDPEAIRWSDINDSDEWTNGVADTQTFPDHGAVQGIFPHAKLILLQSGTRQIVYTGDESSFQFPELTTTKGSLAPNGNIELGGITFWLSDDGFYFGNAFEQRSISHNRLTDYFFNTVNSDRLYQINGTHDPFAPRILIAYPTGDTDYNDRILVYDWSLDRWSEIATNTYVLARTAVPGTTLEGLDSISASLDALGASLDSRIWKGGAPVLAMIDGDIKLSYLNGTPLAARWRTGAYNFVPGWRAKVRGAYPLVEASDASGATLKIGKRGKLSETASQTGAIAAQASGFHRANADARFHDFQYDIPAGASWTNMQGLNPVDFVRTTQR